MQTHKYILGATHIAQQYMGPTKTLDGPEIDIRVLLWEKPKLSVNTPLGLVLCTMERVAHGLTDAHSTVLCTHGGATTTGPDATYPPAICQNSGGGGGLCWVGLAASCRSRPSGVGFLPCPTTRLNNLTVRFQGRADYRQPPDHTEAQVGGRCRRPVCRRARGQGCGRGLGLACGGQVWPGAPGPVGQAMGARR